MNYFGFIYEWTDSTNEKTYTGSHEGLIDDSYIGSGALFKRAYEKRPDKFSRKILEYVYENNRDVLLEVEQKYLNNINWNNTYNLIPFARGGSIKGKKKPPRTDGHNKNISKSKRGKPSGFLGRSHTEKAKQEIGLKNKGEKSGMYGKTHSEEFKQRQSEFMKGEKNPFYGKTHTKENRLKISKRKTLVRSKKKSI